MKNWITLTMVLPFFFIAQACGGNSSEPENENNPEARTTMEVQSDGDCDDLVAEYDKLVQEVLSITNRQMDGEEVPKEETDAINKKAKALGEQLAAKGPNGLGGTHCWDEFMAIQLKWSEAAMKLQEKAMEKAQEAMEEYQNQQDN